MSDISASLAITIRNRFLVVDSSNVADVLDTLGYPDQGLSPAFGPYPHDAGKLAGWAFTIRGQMAPYARGGGDPEKMAACAELTPGSVPVWSGGGEGVSFFGELIAIGMKERGSVGALVDGGVRDLGWLGELDYPVFARYRTPIQSIGRWKVTGWGEPVSVPGATARNVQVSPGDFVLGDVDGAVVIPAAVVEEVLEQAEAIGAKEREIRSDLAAGLSLGDALAKYGHV
jgi:4-hydroxy-4-methyl-2-oxoglutarate aldolase